MEKIHRKSKNKRAVIKRHKGKQTHTYRVYTHRKIAAPRRHAIAAPCRHAIAAPCRRAIAAPCRYIIGTPLKSLAKTQAALFGVVFISTILLSPILMFVRTKESLYSLKVNIYSLKVNDVVI